MDIKLSCEVILRMKQCHWVTHHLNYNTKQADLAHLVEQRPCNAQVVRSSRTVGTNSLSGLKCVLENCQHEIAGHNEPYFFNAR